MGHPIVLDLCVYRWHQCQGFISNHKRAGGYVVPSWLLGASHMSNFVLPTDDVLPSFFSSVCDVGNVLVMF